MHLTRLTLDNFRNYGTVRVDPIPGLNVLLGPNAQGKTNFLEAVYFLATVRSRRAQREAELIRWGEAGARVEARLMRKAGEIDLAVHIPVTGAKEARVQGQSVSRMTDFLGSLHAVSFSPDDLQMVKGSPQERRRYLDVQLCQVSQAYRKHLAAYQRILRQRNGLLRTARHGGWDKETLAAWDEQLIREGAWLVTERARAVGRLGIYAGETHSAITRRQEELTLAYEPFFSRLGQDRSWSSEEADVQPEKVRQVFREFLEQVRGEEIHRGISLVGPQRDDVAMVLDGRDARSFASQGQQRTVVLACKLAELRLMAEEAGETPILLLDDVLSELDAQRRVYLFDTVKERVQTFLTTTHLDGVPDADLAGAHIMRVEAGRIAVTTARGEE